MSKLFREFPPIEVIKTMLNELGLTGLTDTKLFSADELNLETIAEWAPILEPYYLPCKAKRFLSDITDNKRITILRHLLKVHKYDLLGQEKIVNGIKTTTYQIKVVMEYSDLSGDYVMEFS